MSQLSIYEQKKLPKPRSKPVKLKWSFTRRTVLKQCLRRYYFKYCIDKETAASIDNIDIYRALSTKEQVLGEIIHWIIYSSLLNAQKGNEWDQDQIISFGKKMIDDAIKASSKVSSRSASKARYMIMEIVFSEEESSQIQLDSYEQIEKEINHLFSNPSLIRIYEAGKVNTSLLERNTNFKLNDNITVYGQLDLAFYDGHKIKIIDWKTGDSSFEDTSLQLSVYGLWASESEGIAPENTEISKVYLKDNFVDTLSFDSLEIERTKTRIMQDSDQMNELAEFAKMNLIEAFDKTESKDVCDNCAFKRLCYG